MELAYDSVCLLVITEHSHYGLPMYAVLSGAQLIRGVTLTRFLISPLHITIYIFVSPPRLDRFPNFPNSIFI